MSVAEIPLDMQVDMPISVLSQFQIKYVRVHVCEDHDVVTETPEPEVKNVFKMISIYTDDAHHVL